MKTFYIETFGCQMNVHDSEKVAGMLLARGYRRVSTPSEAGLVLYNTCSVRSKAENKVYSRLQQFRREAGDNKVFGVLGCVAQHKGEAIFDKAPHVDLVCGSASYARLPEMLDEIETGSGRVTGLSLDAFGTFETGLTNRGSPHRAFVTIIEGCNNYCAYCVVPSTRGPERSRGSDSILAEARNLAEAGYTEIQLLGQNVNSYRDPSPSQWDFVTLLRNVASVSGLRRVRFTTSNPGDFMQEIVAAIDSNQVLCNHIHLPVQSGSTLVLQRMRRRYSRDDYMRRIDWIKNARRDIAISTDIIVGFPGETDADFAETLSLLDTVEYDSVFSFKYSSRSNTAADMLDSQVSEDDKGTRLRILQEKQRLIQERRNSRLVGTVQEVLVEGYNQTTGQWIGRTSQNRVLNFTVPNGEDAGLTGRYMDVRVTRAGPNSLVGESSDLV